MDTPNEEQLKEMREFLFNLDNAKISLEEMKLQLVAVSLELHKTKLELLKTKLQLLKVEEASHRDPLTAILNRDGLSEELEIILANQIPFVFGILDIDDFKDINDTYGHAKGDEVLKIVTRIIRYHIKSDDVLARFGGDEFVFALLDIHQETALARINQISKILAKGIHLSNNTLLNISISGGLIEYNPNISYVENFEKADHLLYQAKSCGKGIIFADKKSLGLNREKP